MTEIFRTISAVTGFLITLELLFLLPWKFWPVTTAKLLHTCRGRKRKSLFFNIEFERGHKWKLIDGTEAMPDKSVYVIRHCECCDKIERLR